MGGLGICENCRLLFARNTAKINTKAMHTRSKVPTAYKITSNIVNWVFRSRLTVHVLHRAIYLLSFCIKLEVSWEWNYTLWRSMLVGGGWDTGRGGDGEKEWNGKPTLWLLLQFIVTDWEGIFICFTLRNLFFISHVVKVPKKSQYAKTSPTGQK